jgi:PAS domain S-box-containing protein
MDQEVESVAADPGWSGLLAGLSEPALACVAQSGALVVVAANPAVATVLGVPAGEVVGHDPRALFAAGSAPAALSALDVALGARAPLRIDIRPRRADGTETPCALSALPLAGDPPHWLFLFDGARPPPEPQALWHTPAHLRTILDAMPVPLFIKDAQLRIVLMNRTCEEELGVRFDEIVGTDGSAFFPADMMAEFLAIDRRVFAERRTIDVEERSWNAALGEERHRRTIKHPVYDEAGRPLYLIGCSLDITDRHAAQERLRSALQALSQHNRDLREFAHIVSHDLQEPLRKVRAGAERVLSGAGDRLEPALLDLQARAVAATVRMQALIDGLLGLAGASTSDLHRERVDLGALAAAVADDLDDLRARQVGTFDIGALPVVAGDPVQLRQALQNLMANGMKYRAPGRAPRVALSARPAILADGAAAWEIRVQDNGIGFAPEHAERIFAPLVRLHGRSQYEGSGLGLSIVRRVAERHGGEVRATSTPGEGATFSLLLPAG